LVPRGTGLQLMQFNNPPRKIKNNMTAPRLINSIGRSSSRLALFLIPLVFACFALSPAAQAKDHTPTPTPSPTSSPTPSPTPTATPSGQSVNTVLGSGPVVAPAFFTALPGLSMTITLTTDTVVYITTDGGVQVTGGSAVIDLAVYVDGISVPPTRRISSSGAPDDQYESWSLGGSISLTAGSHTITVRAIQSSGAGTATVGGATGSGQQGQLTTLIINQ
jgi:hypothetical protein